MIFQGKLIKEHTHRSLSYVRKSPPIPAVGFVLSLHTARSALVEQDGVGLLFTRLETKMGSHFISPFSCVHTLFLLVPWSEYTDAGDKPL